MNTLVWRQLRRAWRGGELRVLWLALVVAVAAITSLGFFTDRVQRAMSLQATELLAADLVVATSREPPAEWLAQAGKLGLAVARTMEFTSMVRVAERFQLAEVKAVGGAYPLRGRLVLASGVRRGEPARGQVWIDDALRAALSLKHGDVIEVGERSLTVSDIVLDEPDRASAWFSMAPRVLMNRDDVAATGLIGLGSRVSYRILLAGEAAGLADYRRWMASRLRGGDRLLGTQDVRQEIAQALGRGTRFLELAALTSILLAGVAIAMAAMRYSQRQMDGVALMRCLGATRRMVLKIYLGQLAAVWLAGSLLGAMVGVAAQHVLALLLGQLFNTPLPAPGVWPLGVGFIVALLTLAGFALPPLLRLPGVPPLRVLRHEALPPRLSAIVVSAAALGTLAVLALWLASDIKLAGLVVLSAVGAVGVLVAVAWAMVAALRPLRARVGVAWRFGLANIVRRARLSVLQVASFGLGLMVLLLLSVVRVDLLEAWRNSLPAQAPNRFVINVQPDQLRALEGFLAQRLGKPPALYPMARARLVEINHRPVRAQQYASPRAQRLLQHEFNLSWSAQPLPRNRIVEGHWWSATAAPDQFSVERDLAQTLGIRLGDTLTYLLDGRPVSGRVTSLRSVNWDSFQPNFFVIAPPALLRDAPASYITSFYLAPDNVGLVAELSARFPNLTVIDVDALMRKVRAIIERVTQAVQAVFLFTLAAGVLVMIAAIEATQDERRHEAALLRALGASSRQLRLGLISEFALLGALAGGLAALLAQATGFVLATRVFEIGYAVSPLLLPIGIALGAGGVALLGYLGARRVLRAHPRSILC